MKGHYKMQEEKFVTNLNDQIELADKYLNYGDYYAIKRLAAKLKKTAGGLASHEFFWDSLAPTTEGGGDEPASYSDLGKAIDRSFGSFDKFQKDFSSCINSCVINERNSRWLVFNMTTGKLETKCADMGLLMEKSDLVPLLTLDILVDDDYVNYMSTRPELVDKMWEIVNWNKIEERFLAA